MNIWQKNNLFDDKLKFKEDIYSMGYTYDLDKLSGLKKDRFNFIDYFHPTQKVMDSLTGIVWAADTTKLQAIN